MRLEQVNRFSNYPSSLISTLSQKENPSIVHKDLCRRKKLRRSKIMKELLGIAKNKSLERKIKDSLKVMVHILNQLQLSEKDKLIAATLQLVMVMGSQSSNRCWTNSSLPDTKNKTLLTTPHQRMSISSAEKKRW